MAVGDQPGLYHGQDMAGELNFELSDQDMADRAEKIIHRQNLEIYRKNGHIIKII